MKTNPTQPRFPQLQTSLLAILFVLSFDLITKVIALTFATPWHFMPEDDNTLFSLAINSSKTPIAEFRDEVSHPSTTEALPGDVIMFLGVLFMLRYLNPRSEFSTKLIFSVVFFLSVGVVYAFSALLKDLFPSSALLQFAGDSLSFSAISLYWILLTRNKILTIAVAFFYGGGLANIIGTIYYPYGVIDFIDYGPGVINLADVFILIGETIFLFWSFCTAVVLYLNHLFKNGSPTLISLKKRFLSVYD